MGGVFQLLAGQVRYHFDVTPDAVHCRGWFAPAETVYRVGNIYARLRNASRP